MRLAKSYVAEDERYEFLVYDGGRVLLQVNVPEPEEGTDLWFDTPEDLASFMRMARQALNASYLRADKP